MLPTATAEPYEDMAITVEPTPVKVEGTPVPETAVVCVVESGNVIPELLMVVDMCTP